MNLLIAFVILLVFFVSETGQNHPVDDVWLRLVAIGITTFVVPMLAAFQTVSMTRKLQQEDCDLERLPRQLKRLTACHSAVWLVASLAIVYSFQWQKIVRGNWGLDRWWLIDELLIITPVLLSLIASWAIFFDIQHVFAPKNIRESVAERFKFVSLRVRVYLAVFLVPMLLVFGAKDVLDSQLASTESVFWIGTLVGLPLLLATFPFMVTAIWQTEKIDQGELLDTVNEINQKFKLKVARVRIWKTSRQIVNAVVAGVFPYFRVILISDGLAKNFSQVQLAAILRHEAGHFCRHHLLSRIFFIVLPLAIFSIAEWSGYATTVILEKILASLALPVVLAMPAMALAYSGYLLLALVWLSQKMEYDADQFAISQKDADGNFTFCKTSCEAMESALLQFAQLMPEQVDRKSLWHPTIRKRLIRLEQLKRNPTLLNRFSEDFVYHQFLLLAGTLVFSTLFFIVVESVGF